MKTFDYIVVGSGCSGAMAAQTLVEAGMNVTMVDVGEEDKTYKQLVPDADFTTLRKTDQQQHRYLLGDELEGVSWGKVGKGEQITPPRKHISRLTDQYLALQSDNFSPLESLGYGGLGIGWGLQCWKYSSADLQQAGLDQKSMQTGYDVVSSRIGISAMVDDAQPYTIGNLAKFQPSPSMDINHQHIYAKYLRQRKQLNRQGLFLGRTPLALITEDFNDRKAYAYSELDFYSDRDKSAWRPWITVDNLRKKPNFNYLGGLLVTSFKETATGVTVSCLEVPSNKKVQLHCKRLILATGALGSARIVLRSSGKPETTLPILCNPYSYVPSLQPRLIGRQMERRKLGFAQLSLFLDRDQDNSGISVASLYDYHSLMLFRIIRQVPLNMADGRAIMRYLMSGLEIMGIHHPDVKSDLKYLSLHSDASTPTGDRLHVNYQLSEAERRKYDQRDRQFISAMRKMGTYALKRINPGYGASIHYAGTLPFSKKQQEYSLDPSGRLHGTRSVFVADSSGFNYLPAPGLTFSLMANAHNVATRSLRQS